MGLSYYFEVHVRRAGASGLRLRGVDVLTAQDDAGSELGDAELMDRARDLGRAIFTQDRDFLIEADRRQESGEACAGVIYAHQLKVTVGGVRRRLGIDRENLRARRKVVLQKLQGVTAALVQPFRLCGNPEDARHKAGLSLDLAFAYPFDLPLPNYMQYFVPPDRSTCRLEAEESGPRSDSAFDEAMALLHKIVKIFALP